MVVLHVAGYGDTMFGQAMHGKVIKAIKIIDVHGY